MTPTKAPLAGYGNDNLSHFQEPIILSSNLNLQSDSQAMGCPFHDCTLDISMETSFWTPMMGKPNIFESLFTNFASGMAQMLSSTWKPWPTRLQSCSPCSTRPRRSSTARPSPPPTGRTPASQRLEVAHLPAATEHPLACPPNHLGPRNASIGTGSKWYKYGI